MRLTLIVAVLISSALANPYVMPEADMGLLTIWPTARGTALAGSMTGLADEADAAYFNPAGLAFQTTAKASVSYGDWLPGLYPGMRYANTAVGAPLNLRFPRGRNAYISGHLTYMTLGETDVVDEHGDYLGRMNVWRGVAAACAGVSLTDDIGIGVGMKLLMSVHSPDVWWWDLRAVGGSHGGSQTAVAADIGLRWCPSSAASIGLAVANVGPSVHYWSEYGYLYGSGFPRVARLGLCWTPVESHDFQLHVMPELDKTLVGLFKDTTGRKPLGRKMEIEWKDAWKALGIEATLLSLVSLRVGYFADLTNQRGGMVLKNNDGVTYHYGLWDAMTRKGLGQLKSIGLCWGLGVGTNVLRFDLSSDAAIYDFPTQNWKLQLTCNDIGRLLGVRS